MVGLAVLPVADVDDAWELLELSFVAPYQNLALVQCPCAYSGSWSL